MADISNKTLAILVGIALVVSIIGVFGPSMTGRATTAQGTAYIYPLGALAISIVDNSIDFLNGTIGDTPCTIDSADGSKSGDCHGTTWLNTKDVFVINNTGTVNANVTIKASKSAAEWITGTNPAQQYRALDCTGQTSYTNLLKDTETRLCDSLPNTTTAEVAMKVTVANDAAAGRRDNTITFTAYQV